MGAVGRGWAEESAPSVARLPLGFAAEAARFIFLVMHLLRLNFLVAAGAFGSALAADSSRLQSSWATCQRPAHCCCSSAEANFLQMAGMRALPVLLDVLVGDEQPARTKVRAQGTTRARMREARENIGGREGMAAVSLPQAGIAIAAGVA